MTDFTVIRHILCRTPVVWEKCGDEGTDGDRFLDLYCPRCKRRVVEGEVTVHGPYVAYVEPPR